MSFSIFTHSKEETQQVASHLATLLHEGQVILLEGDLGAGKTTFVGGVGKALGIAETIASPTFNILKCYFEAKPPMYHIDAYRLEGQNIELGLEEFIEGDGVCLIEWPQYIAPLLPKDHLKISFYHVEGDKRKLVFEGMGKEYRSIVEKMEEMIND